MIQIKKDSKFFIRFSLLFICLMSLLMTSCARTVSNTSFLLTMQIKITFREIPDLASNHYYFIFSGIEAPNLPVVPPDKYFPTPGRLFDDTNSLFFSQGNSISTFYENFYSTWSDYLIYNDDGIKLYKSNDTKFSATTTDNIGAYPAELNFSYDHLSVSDKTITIQFSIQSLSPVNPNELFFTFATAKKDTENPNSAPQSGILKDTLDLAIQNKISILKNQRIGPLTDDANLSISGDLDIDTWEVQVF